VVGDGVMVVVMEVDDEEESGGFGVVELWRFPWRWGRKKMKVGWRSCGGCCCSDGDEGDGGD